MKVTGTLINYYFHCKRQCYLAGNRINLEDNSENVKIGKALHETKRKTQYSEVAIEQIKIDKIQGDYLIEYKKSNSDLKACKWQVYLYLSVLKAKGIEKKGKLIFFENKTKTEKRLELELTNEIEVELEKVVESIQILLEQNVPPEPIKTNRCKKCAYFDYCYI